MANLVTIFFCAERKALMDLRRWRAKLPVRRTQCAESGYGWRYREDQRWSAPSNRQTARQNTRWSHTWSVGGRQTAIKHHIRQMLMHQNIQFNWDKPAKRRGPLWSTRWLWCPLPSPLSQCHGSWQSFPPCRTYWGSGWTKKKNRKGKYQQRRGV